MACCTSPSALHTPILSQCSSPSLRSPTVLSLFAPFRLSKVSYSGGSGASGSRVAMSVDPRKAQTVAGLTALAFTAAMVIPEIAEAAQPGVSPSLKNLLLSVIAGGTVLLVLAGVVAGVSTFDPVKRI